MGHMGTVKKGEFIFPKGSFCRARRAGRSRRGLNRAQKNEVYLSYTFPRSAAFKAGEVIFSPGIREGRKIFHLTTSFHFCATD